MDATFYTISVWALPVIFAITLHEAAHGWVAEQFGDDTARKLGRITANPIRHIDPIGTVALPAILLAAQAPMLFGYAKPVPVNTARLEPRRMGMVLVAFAGPATNLLLALLCALTLAFAEPVRNGWLYANLLHGVLINVTLAVFNILPILPLDGGRVLHALLPARVAQQYRKTEPFGMVILLVLVMFPALGAMDLIFDVMSATAKRLLVLTGNV